MIFFPYRLDTQLNGTPFFTVLISSLCFFFFIVQLYSEYNYSISTEHYCKHELTSEAAELLEELIEYLPVGGCIPFFMDLTMNIDDPQTLLNTLTSEAKLTQEELQILQNELIRFNSIVTSPLTIEWWDNPNAPEILNYFTSSVIHADWPHLIFNLIFFLAFSIAAEQVLGGLFYLTLVALCCLTTGFAYGQGLFGQEAGTLSTLGLSGVVMGMMAFTALLFPTKKVAVFYWLLLFFGTVRIPLLFVVLFYVTSDMVSMFYLNGEENINYVAHLSGAAAGGGFALMYLGINYLYNQLKKPSAKS